MTRSVFTKAQLPLTSAQRLGFLSGLSSLSGLGLPLQGSAFPQLRLEDLASFQGLASFPDLTSFQELASFQDLAAFLG